MKIRKPYTRTQTQTVNTDPSRTKQSDSEHCEINNIMAKYARTGAINHFNTHQGNYGDATGHDFQTAMNIVTDAQNMFNDLPSTLRNRFDNEPSQFLDFVNDEANISEMAELGLLNAPIPGQDFNPDQASETAAVEEPAAETS